MTRDRFVYKCYKTKLSFSNIRINSGYYRVYYIFRSLYIYSLINYNPLTVCLTTYNCWIVSSEGADINFVGGSPYFHCATSAWYVVPQGSARCRAIIICCSYINTYKMSWLLSLVIVIIIKFNSRLNMHIHLEHSWNYSIVAYVPDL